jgi:hypothetical protein
MKSPKRIAAILITGFLAFAPPGTMIFLLALVIGLVGRRWAAASAILCVGAGTAFLLLRRRSRLMQRREGRTDHPEGN